MNKTLNIVNGDACIEIMKKAGVSGIFLPWHDFLHEGPVPANLTLEALSKVRATFIASCGFGALEKIYADFQERDNLLKSFKNYNKVLLWFEHDLYDQLQLIQILSWFATQELGETRVSLICTSQYLGEASQQQIQKLLQYDEQKIDNNHLNLATKAWQAFSSSMPTALFKFMHEATGHLPFLKGAIYRLLEEYPNTKNGLSRTQYQSLIIISDGISDMDDIFSKYQSFEERKFMGDIIFFNILHELKAHKVIESNANKQLKLTALGENILDGNINWLSVKEPKHFIGGVELTKDNLWCWDIDKKEIKHYYFSKVLNALLLVK